MADWFARAVLHVTDVEVSLHFYVNRLGCTSPWRYDEDGKAHVAQVDRQGCAFILADTCPEKIGKGLMLISLNVRPPTPERTAPRAAAPQGRSRGGGWAWRRTRSQGRSGQRGFVWLSASGGR